jgi:hypothetical protein
MVQSEEKVLSRLYICLKSDLDDNDIKSLDKIYHDSETCIIMRTCYYIERENMEEYCELGLHPTDFPRLYKNADSQMKSSPFFDRSVKKPIKGLAIQLEDKIKCFPLDYRYWQLLAVKNEDISTIVTSLEVLDFPFTAKRLKLKTCFRMSGDPVHLKLLLSYYFDKIGLKITDAEQKTIDESIVKGLPQIIFLERYATHKVFEVYRFYYDSVPSFEILQESDSFQEFATLFSKNLDQLKSYNAYSGEYEIMADGLIGEKIESAFKKAANDFNNRYGSCMIFSLLPQ